MSAFIIISDLFRTSRLPDFVDVYPGAGLLHPHFLAPSHISFIGPAWYINLLSWIFSFLIVFGVIWTGKAADKGQKWAAGNRAYTRIRDRGDNE
jgi:hypothetical protein